MCGGYIQILVLCDLGWAIGIKSILPYPQPTKSSPSVLAADVTNERKCQRCKITKM